jgi:large subunit ribosomal protein L30
MQARIAIIRIRGNQKIKKEIEDTMRMLRLFKKNHCVIIKNTPQNIGMLKKIKDYVTWGDIDDKTFKLLLEKRGKLPGNKKLTEEYIKEKLNLNLDTFSKEFIECKKDLKEIPGVKEFFKLTPPLKGFERKGIKTAYSLGGVLGYRKQEINQLIQRMA